MNITRKEAEKEIRQIARENNLVFKRQPGTVNGKAAYQFCELSTGIPAIKNLVFWTAYETAVSGYLKHRGM